MISAQSRQQLLNGNKLKCISTYCIALVFLGLYSCVPKQVTTTDTDDEVIVVDQPEPVIPPTPVEPPKQPVQTTPTPVEVIPVETPEQLVRDKKERYSVAYVLPFLTEKSYIGKVPKSSKRALDFWQGTQVAIEQLDQKFAKIDIKVFDSQADTNKIDQLAAELKNFDIIIGGVLPANIQRLADIAKENKTVYFSPLNPNHNVTNNHHFIQAIPTLESHFKTVVKDIKLSGYQADEVVFATRIEPSDIAYFNMYEKIMQQTYGTTESTVNIKHLNVQKSDLRGWADITFGELINKDSIVIVLPTWKDEGFINAIMRELNLEARNKSIRVYGMPQWLSRLKSSNFNHFNKLNVHVPSAHFIDNEADEFKAFRERYFNLFGATPSTNAYRGYDLLYFVNDVLQEDGSNLNYFVDGDKKDYLHTDYQLEYVRPENTTGDTINDSEIVDCIENKAIKLLEFSEFRYNEVVY